MTVGAMRAAMSHHELIEWQAFFRLRAERERRAQKSSTRTLKLS
jgi:hypothetical protein